MAIIGLINRQIHISSLGIRVVFVGYQSFRNSPFSRFVVSQAAADCLRIIYGGVLFEP